MPTEEQKNRTLKEENANIARSSIELSNHIKDLEKEIPSLTQTRDDLIYEIDVVEKRIKVKQAEQDSNLNIKDQELTALEGKLKKREDDVVASEETLKIQNVSLENKTIKCEEREEENSNIFKQVLSEIAKLKSQQSELEKLIEEKKAEPAPKDLTAELQGQISKYMSKNTEIDSLKRVYEQGIITNKSANVGLINRKTTLDEEIQKAKSISQSSNAIKSELNSAIASANKAKRDYENKMNDFADMEKKIQYAWLRINKRITEKQIDINIEELQQ